MRIAGATVSATRQKAGRFCWVAHPGLPVVQPGGVLKLPAGTSPANVMVVSASGKLIRPSQGVAADAAKGSKERQVSADDTTPARPVFMIPPSVAVRAFRAKGIAGARVKPYAG